MVLVNNPGSWQHVYPPLLHAEWNGFTPTDLVFPAFLFAVGMAIPFTLSGYAKADAGRTGPGYTGASCAGSCCCSRSASCSTPRRRSCNGRCTARRSIGADLRIMGVLQRIALAYLIAIDPRSWRSAPEGAPSPSPCCCSAIGRLMTLVPVPGYGAGVLTPDGSLATYIDRLILTPRISIGTASIPKACSARSRRRRPC